MSEKTIPQPEMKQMMLDIMQDIHDFCEKNGLRYYLAFGTMIGAIRHKGFIPWDDDIDLWMPRPDYEKFMHMYNHPYYRVMSMYTDKDYPLEFMKVHDTRTRVEEEGGDGKWGVFVDIFPFEGIPNEKIWRRRFKKVIAIRHLIANRRFTWKYKVSEGHSLSKKAAIVIAKCIRPFVNLNCLLRWQDRTIKKYDFNECDYMCDYTASPSKYPPFIVPKEKILDRVLMDFEGRKYYGPKEYDFFLTLLYGDYMKLPPKEKQVSVHGSKAYWK